MKTYYFIKNHIKIILALVAIFIVTSISVYFTYRTYSIGLSHSFFVYEDNVEHPSEATFWLGYTGIILSFISIITVIVTLIVQLRELELQKISLEDNYKISEDTYNAYILKLVEKFLGPEMSECRKTCWLLRSDIKVSKTKLEKMKKLFIMQIKDNWGTRAEYQKLQSTVAFGEYAMFTKLIRFFDMLSHYRITKETAYAIHFYYVWWRGFFIEMIDCYNQAKASISSQEIYMTVDPSWIDLVERMDMQMIKQGLAIN